MLTPRGAKVRDTLRWSQVLDDVLVRFGGAVEGLRKGIAAFETGDYRWVAIVFNHLVFAGWRTRPEVPAGTRTRRHSRWRRLVSKSNVSITPGAPQDTGQVDQRVSGDPATGPSTIHAILDRHGLVKRRKCRHYKAKGTALGQALSPNALRCADYKVQFLLGNKQYCYPPRSLTSARVICWVVSRHITAICFSRSTFDQVVLVFGRP